MSNSTTFQSKLDTIIDNYEAEKGMKNIEISNLNLKLNSVIKSVEGMIDTIEELKVKKQDADGEVKILTEKNENILKDIESKIEAFEQIKKLDNSEIKEDDLTQEIRTLENKYDEMVTNWEEYSGQAKTKIDELKSLVETKKKEYNFKYEKITELKKEIDDISSRAALKQELSGFLAEEYSKIPLDINRNKFISKISELTGNIVGEKNNIHNYIIELRNSENQIVQLNDTIKRVDNELEDKLFQDAKNNSNLKELYSLFIKIRDGYNIIQKDIIDNQIAKNRLKELENKRDDYQIKLKQYDITQLKEQVELMKLENKK
jgi:chromosome segregation ATPase